MRNLPLNIERVVQLAVGSVGIVSVFPVGRRIHADANAGVDVG
jgi:hypothetical protein